MRIHALPIFLGTLCVLAIAYRFYSAFLASKVFALDAKAQEHPFAADGSGQAGVHAGERVGDGGCRDSGEDGDQITRARDLPGGVIQGFEARGGRVEVDEPTLLLYPRAVRWFVDDLLRVEGSVVRHVRGEPQLLLA